MMKIFMDLSRISTERLQEELDRRNVPYEMKMFITKAGVFPSANFGSRIKQVGPDGEMTFEIEIYIQELTDGMLPEYVIFGPKDRSYLVKYQSRSGSRKEMNHLYKNIEEGISLLITVINPDYNKTQ